MTIEEKIAEVINNYVISNGTADVMDRAQLYSMVNAIYPMNRNSFLPSDFCYNRTNEGIDFEKRLHLFERKDDGRYLILGEGYSFSGPVYYRKRGETEDSICGIWTDGIYNKKVLNDTLLRLEDLYDGVCSALKVAPVTVVKKENSVLVQAHELLMCGIVVETAAYRIYNVSADWAEQTTYLCEETGNGIRFYYLETIDECIGEVNRLVTFETQNNKRPPLMPVQHTSELRETVSAAAFEKAYRAFIEQAEKNAVSGKAQGSKIPYGFSEKPKCDGALFKLQYGQGSPSAAPYMNWWVVSVYYEPKSGNILLGIEEDRYPHLKDMSIKPKRYGMVGSKKISTAVFYEASSSTINYAELYEAFINVCEDVMKLGLF